MVQRYVRKKGMYVERLAGKVEIIHISSSLYLIDTCFRGRSGLDEGSWEYGQELQENNAECKAWFAALSMHYAIL